ncbi:MAG: heavy metal sensor histidine kinase, partial [Burkholderiaceae bacterium]
GLGLASATLVLDSRDDAAFVRRLGMTLMAASLAGALLVSLGGFLLVRMALAPVRRLVDQTRAMAAENLHERLDAEGLPDELLPMVDQFNALLERLRQSYAQLEGFNADVAHELRTPLATLIASTELAMRQPDLQERTLDHLGSNLEDLRRMTGIVNDMLFLSHAHSGVLARRHPVDSLAGLASDVADYHEAALAEADLTLRTDGEASGDFDAALLKRALSNLIGNATRYATPGSTIRVCIESHGMPGVVRLSVANQGPPIAPDHLPRLFDRFYRADPSRKRGKDHHGLGLSIVAAIARMHGGEPFASSEHGVTRIGLSLTGARIPARAKRLRRRRLRLSTRL